MELACNYSPQLIELLRAKEVDIDYIKLALYEGYYDGFENDSGLKPVLLHGINPGLPERVGIASYAGMNWQKVQDVISKYQSPHLAVHLDCRREDWGNAKPGREAVIARLIAGARAWSENISVPFLVENIPFSSYYEQRGTFSYTVEPEVISRVCAEAGIDLLLDLAHARVTAWYRGEPVQDYLTQLPLDKVKEIHLSAPVMTEDTGFRDRHLEMTEFDYQLLKWILKETSPRIITLEYGGPGPNQAWRSNTAALSRQLLRIREIIAENITGKQVK
ncbi:MAG: DUF692 family multinuclear iron-containing protein [Halanaerobium sp.]|nr:DUF692 family multinuclear iron-containing protein [Halanaerobium sp.]